jgi:Cu+-exporting ATPase
MKSHELHDRHFQFHLALTCVVGALLVLNWLGIFKTAYGWDTAIFLAVLGGYRIFYESLTRLLRREISADLAVAIAALGALYIRQYFVAAEVIFIMLVGEALEDVAVGRTRSAIRKLLKLSPQTARVRRGNEETIIPIEQVTPGTIVIVRPGERIPVDGIVVAGSSSVNQSTLTGESMPVSKEPGSEVFTSTINEMGMLEVKTMGVGPDTKLGEVIRLVEEAEASRAPTERRADRWATYFVPIVLGAAVITYLVTRNSVAAISVLVVACPCALILATPTAIVAAIGRLACEGILVKGGSHLEAVGRTDWMVFDKTGTLTWGRPKIAEIVAFSKVTEQEVLGVAATAEQHSEHHLANLIVAEARRRGAAIGPLDEFKPAPGLGVEVKAGGMRLLAGNARFMTQQEVAISPEAQAALRALDEKGRTVVLVARDHTLLGVIAAEDEIRSEAARAVTDLKAFGLRGTTLLTGDNAKVAHRVARHLGIHDVKADLMPADKVSHVRELRQAGHKVAMVGDGVNDAPSLVAADVGVALGGIGTDITAEAAGVVLMTDNLAHLKELLRISRIALEIIKENILFFGIGLNAVGVLAAATSYLTPVAAAILHQISSLLVVSNSLRLLYGARLGETAPVRRLRLRLEAMGQTARDAVSGIRKRWKTALASLLILGAALYLASGLFAVRPGEVGIVRVFGKRIGGLLDPGLHYAPPWPFGRADCISLTEVKRVEVGFRTVPVAPGAPVEPTAYEWNIQHRTGRYIRVPEETLLLTGDENLVELNMVVQYAVTDPVNFLFRVKDVADPARRGAEEMIRICAEATMCDMAARSALYTLLTDARSEVEEAAAKGINERLRQYEAGLTATSVRLQDVHPPLEVVDAFRAVSSAFEEKEKLINEAKADALRAVQLAQGNGKAQQLAAQATSEKRVNQATGDAARFELTAAAYEEAPVVTRIRLMLETMETVLPPIQKVIRGANWKGRHDLIFFNPEGVAPKAPPAQPETAPPTQQGAGTGGE